MIIDFENIYREFEASFFKDYRYLGNFLKEERKMGMIAEEGFEDEANFSYDCAQYNQWVGEEVKEEIVVEPVKPELSLKGD